MMARPITHQVKVNTGIDISRSLAEKQGEILASPEQALRESRREAILAGGEAHPKILEKVFNLNRGARVRNSNDHSVIFWPRFHEIDDYGTIREKKLEPNDIRAKLGIIGATVVIPRDPRLKLGVDIQSEDLEQQIVVAAAIKGIKSPALDFEPEDSYELDGLYVPTSSTESVEQFQQHLYETVSHNASLVMAAELSEPTPEVVDALAVIDVLHTASVELNEQNQG
jgi:hypothetical protein